MKRSISVKWILLFIIGVPFAIFIFGGAVMLLWNKVLVQVIHVSPVSFWQALGILVLSKILFGSFAGGNKSGGNSRRERWMWKQMTPEQKARFKEEWRRRGRRCGPESELSETPGSTEHGSTEASA